jgi:aminoglycoside phosphotransferase family enzyme/predicted kinase
MALNAQQEIVAFLSDPATYPHCRGTVERIETHAAMIFLAGDRAYKIKKPVVYPYLDFATLRSREAALRREFELNRRTAETLYLGLAPVTRAGTSGLRLGGEGEVLEWVLVMRRFDQDDLFERRAIAGRLSVETMRELADRIADFHAIARPVVQAAPGGGMLAVLDIDRRGFLQSADAFPEDVVRALRYQEVAEGELARLCPLLVQRRAEGRVRHCHGDLHLGNICFLDNRPTLFDCIEFSETLAEIDVLYDLAFLLMDLEQRDLRNLGNAVFNRYFDRRDEDSGAPALAFFQSTRAAVRAHVGLTGAGKAPMGAVRDAGLAQARRYLSLAEKLLKRRAGKLIAIGGLSGSGKSKVAGALAPNIGAPPGSRVLRSDVERKRLMGVEPEAKLPASAYAQAVSAKVYDEIFRRAALWLGAGHSVILDGVFATPEERNKACALAREQSADFAGIWLEAPAATMRARILARSGDASDATPEVLDRQLTYDLGPIDWFKVSAGRDFADVLAQARSFATGS